MYYNSKHIYFPYLNYIGKKLKFLYFDILDKYTYQLSSKIMHQPILNSDNITYDRSSIDNDCKLKIEKFCVSIEQTDEIISIIQKNVIIKYGELLLSEPNYFKHIPYNNYHLVLNLTDYDGNTLLMWLCKQNNIDHIEWLIKKFGMRCKPNHINKLGQTALMYLCMHRYSTDIMCKEFKNLCLPSHIDYYKNTALIYACKNGSVEMAKILINHFDIDCLFNQVNCENKYALYYACINNDKYSFEKLTKFDYCDALFENRIDLLEDIIKLLYYYYNYDFAIYFIKKYGTLCNINYKNSEGQDILTIACCENKTEFAMTLMDKIKDLNISCCDVYGNYPLYYACFVSNNEIALKILETYGRLSIPTTQKYRCPLYIACANSMSDVAIKIIDLIDDENIIIVIK